MDRLNHFTPYNRKESHHEDQLTRALLVTLKYVPMAQALFIDLVREAQIEGGSESPIPPLSYRDSEISSIETQVTKIRAEEGRLVSIVLSDDQWKQTHVVKASSRRAVYDGIILHEPGWILIIENKPRSESIWPEQLNPSLAQDSQIEIDPVLVNLSWRSVIEHLSSLAERNLVVGAEKLILDDFFDFVDKHFTYLGVAEQQLNTDES